jgi:hypothetical protein
MKSLYDPSTYPQGVPNPYGPRVHAWNGGPWDQGTRYHGAIYDRPQATFPWHERPLAAVGGENESWLSEHPTYRAIAYVGSMAGLAAGAYHGYKRNDSVGWAIGWAVLGSLFWPIALPIMFAQGFGQRKK